MKCERCGLPIDENVIMKRRARGINDTRCSDCRMKPLGKVRYEDDYCMPHKGEVDNDFNPIDSRGNLYMPGIRTCGHRDCIRKTHIIRRPKEKRNPEYERLDISYRTGKPFKLERTLEEAS